MPPRKGWAAVYCRLSKEDEEKTARESESIRNQRALLLAWAAEHGYRIYRVYTDEDYSGIDRARPGFNAMLADARAGKFEVILAKTQSRFTRDMELVEKYLHGLFPEWGVRFIAVLDHVARNGYPTWKLGPEWTEICPLSARFRDLSARIMSCKDPQQMESLQEQARRRAAELLEEHFPSRRKELSQEFEHATEQQIYHIPDPVPVPNRLKL